MKRCPRGEFLLFSQGILIDRYANKKVYVGDTLEAREALEAHDRGETIALTAGKYGPIVSHICRGVETPVGRKGVTNDDPIAPEVRVEPKIDVL